MAESIHDMAIKLEMIRDEASFSAAEKLQDNFTNAMIRNNERIKRSNEERAAAERQTRMDAEGNLIRRKNQPAAQNAAEDANRQMERLDELYIMNSISASTYDAELENIFNTYVQVADGAQQAADAERAFATLHARTLAAQQAEKQSISELSAMRDHYLDQEREAAALGSRRRGAITAGDTRLAGEDNQAFRRIERLATAEERRDRAIRRLQADITATNSTNAVYVRGLAEINQAYEQETRVVEEVTNDTGRLNNLLRQYSTHVERVTADIEELNRAHAAGEITTEQHGRAIAEATIRMNGMRAGAGNTGYAIGELARGAEDFITVMSITGFSMDSVGMAMRGASNNISQAASLMGGPLQGALIGTGALLLGQTIPYFFRSAEAVDDYSDALERAIRVTSGLYDAEERRLKNVERFSEIKNINNPAALKAQIKTDRDEVERINNDHARAMNSVAQNARVISEKMLPQTLADKYNKLFKAIYTQDPELANGLKRKFDEINSELVTNLEKVGPSEALPAFERSMLGFNAGLRRLGIENLAGVSKVAFTGSNGIWDAESVNNAQAITGSAEEMKKYVDEYLKLSNEALDLEQARKDAVAAIAEATARQAATEKTFRMTTLQSSADELAIAEATSEAEKRKLTFWQNYAKLKAEYKDMGAFGVGLAMEQATAMQKTQDAQVAAQEKERMKTEALALEHEYEKLKVLSDEKLLLSKLKDEEKYRYEWSKRRAEIMESGAGSPAALEAIFNNELMAQQNNLNKQWKDSAPAMAVGSASSQQALGEANKQIMQAMGPTKDKELIKEIKALGDIFRGKLSPVTLISN